MEGQARDIVEPTRLCYLPHMRVLRFFFSFELLLVLSVFAGYFKADPRLAWVPVDLTALLFASSVAAGAFILGRRGRLDLRGLQIVVPSLVFVGWAVLSLAWTPGWDYATDKAMAVATLTLWPLIATALIVAPDPARFRRFLLALVLLGGVMSVEALRVWMTRDEYGFVGVFGSNYLGVGRMAGLMAVIAFCAYMTEVRSVTRSSAVILLALAALLVSGGRAPLFAAAVAMLIPALTGFRPQRVAITHRTALVCVAGLVMVTAIPAFGSDFVTMQRLSVLFGQEGGGESASVRMELYGQALDAWVASPIFGHGIGSFPVVSDMGDVRNYPHNILLEVAAELGLVGLLLFAVLLAAFLWTVMQATTPERVFVLTIVAYMFVNAMISGDLSDNRALFMALGPASATKRPPNLPTSAVGSKYRTRRQIPRRSRAG